MSDWSPDTRHMNMGEVAGRVRTNRLLRRAGGVSFAAKMGRDRLGEDEFRQRRTSVLTYGK